MNQEDFIDKNDSIDLMAELRYYLFFWPWYLTCAILMFFGSFLYKNILTIYLFFQFNKNLRTNSKLLLNLHELNG